MGIHKLPVLSKVFSNDWAVKAMLQQPDSDPV